MEFVNGQVCELFWQFAERHDMRVPELYVDELQIVLINDEV